MTQGTLTHYHADCAVDGVYPQGSALREPGGPSDVHLGRDLGDRPLVIEALYVLSHGAPFAEDAPNPGCPFE